MATTTTTTTAAPEEPIRIGFIGLSKTSSWASQAHLPYLKSTLGRRRFRIAALCNSSVDAARAAIAAHGLDAATTKAYGSPDHLAADPDVDLVVVCVKAPLHAAMVRPVIAATTASSRSSKKRLFVEYPLGASIDESRELVALAERHGLAQRDLACGMEEAYDACVNKVRELVAEKGLIGRVLQSTVDAAGYPLAGRVPEKGEYALQRASGASFNGPSHLLNAVTYVLGPLASHSTRDLNLAPDVDIVSAPEDGSRVLRRVTKDSPDHTVFVGQFEAPTTKAPDMPGAAFVGSVRTDRKWPGEPTILWRIMGERGQLKITVPGSFALEFDDGTTIEHFDYETGEVKEIAWKRGGEGGEDEDEKILAALPGASRTIGRTYEAFAKGKHVGVADWQTALKLHEFMNRFLNG